MQATVSVMDIVQEIADQLRIADPSLSWSNEVQFTFDREFLPGTEVRAINEGGKLHVSFVTSSTESLHLISANGWTIQKELQRQLNFPVFVDLQTIEQDSGPDLP